jgi:cell division GTPase FtsZ
MPAYGDPKYWDETYKNSRGDALYDWLESYETLQGVLSLYLKNQNMRILVLGCGNAGFSEDLYDHGFKNQVNVDISSVVID